MGSKPTRKPRSGNVRIIGGRWRGRKILLADDTAIRPTPDRVRETLFNWLAPNIAESRCLDLYAGSGVLGLEALSRGAGEVVFVDQLPAVTRQLATLLETLKVSDCLVCQADAEGYLSNPPSPFDIVFLDPPFGTGLAKLCTLLAGGWLAPGARVYLESNRKEPLPELPEDWQLLREKTAGQIRFALAQRG
ncbi:MAG: 16S rRNA (guanine(966)-N(2))-methyltransferase RsmD [Gammaproteobacteria bacterium]